MKLFYADHFVLPLPPGHRFPMEKYSRLRERLLASGHFATDDFRVPDAATDTELLRAHDAGYVQNISGAGVLACQLSSEGVAEPSTTVAPASLPRYSARSRAE